MPLRDKEKRREYNKKYREENKEKVGEWKLSLIKLED